MLPKIRTILYCTDLGRYAPYVFGYAYSLADQLGARIVVLYVIESLTGRQRALVEGYSGQGSLGSLLEQAETEAAQQIPARIEKFCATEAGEENWNRIVSEIIVARGRAADEILQNVKSRQADLVVVGAHVESSVLDHLLGSTARTLVKNCPVPVLTVQVPDGVAGGKGK